MSIAAQTASALVRAACLAGVAVAISGWLAASLAGQRGRAKSIAWALLLAPFLTPALLISYAFSRLSLALTASPWSHQTLYATVLLLKLVPVAVVARSLMPSPLSAEARHCHRLLSAPSFFERVLFRLRASGPAPWFAGGLVFLLAFADFELASLWNIKTWTVVLFDAQTGGLAWRESLRLAAWPLAIQVAVLAVLTQFTGSVRPVKTGAGNGGAAIFGYLAIVAFVVCALPLLIVFAQAVAGFPAVAENFVLGNEIIASALFAAGAAAVSCRGAYASRVLVSASRRNELPDAFESGDVFVKGTVSKVREGGTPSPTLGTRMLPGVPGLLGSLIVALFVLAVFQTPLLRPLYDTPLPLLLALTIILLPLALLLGALLRMRHASPMRHIARQLGSRRLAWDLETQPRLAAFALLFCWAYFDFTASAILAPTRFTPVFVRLHNLAHYGQTAVLSAMMLAAFAVPVLLLLLTFAAGQIHARR